MKQEKKTKSFPFIYESVVIAVLLFATGLRFARLDVQSFWNDEGNTARLIERTIPLIIEGAAGDVHPPGYYLLLHGFRAVVGETEFALRSYSVLCGVLTIALTVAVVKTLIKNRPGLSWIVTLPTLLFISMNPLAVYYSQEVRMYAQLGLAAMYILWAAVKFQAILSRPRQLVPRIQYVIRFILLVIAVVFGLYTHYAFVFILASLSLAYGVFWLIYDLGNWRTLFLWLNAFALGGLLYLPWLPVALGASGWRPPDLGATDALASMARTLVVGVTLPDQMDIYILPALVVFCVLIAFNLPKLNFTTWVAFATAFLPMTMIAVLGLYRPAYLKFLIMSVGPLAVCFTSLMAAIRRRYWITILFVGMLLFFTPAQLNSLRHLYTDPAYFRDDYRGIVNFIEMEARPGDGVLLHAPNQWEVFTYYYHGELPIYTAPYRPTQSDAVAWVEHAVKNHEQLFMLYWGETEADPDRLIESELAKRAFKAEESWISSVRLSRYGTVKSVIEITPVQSVMLGQAINLIGYGVHKRALIPGEILPVTLDWTVINTPVERYKVFVHLQDSNGKLVAQTDAEPVGGLLPTSQWIADRLIRDNYGVVLPDDMIPGNYTILIGMYDFSGQRLIITRYGAQEGDYFLLDTITVKEQQ